VSVRIIDAGHLLSIFLTYRQQQPVKGFELVHALVPNTLGVAQTMRFIDDEIVKVDPAQERPVFRLLFLKARNRNQDNVQGSSLHEKSYLVLQDGSFLGGAVELDNVQAWSESTNLIIPVG
jgi:hypothetical protein